MTKDQGTQENQKDNEDDENDAACRYGEDVYRTIVEENKASGQM